MANVPQPHDDDFHPDPGCFIGCFCMVVTFAVTVGGVYYLILAALR
jgi:hypothetical protein